MARPTSPDPLLPYYEPAETTRPYHTRAEPPGPEPGALTVPVSTYGEVGLTPRSSDGFSFRGSPLTSTVSRYEFEGSPPTPPPLEPYEAPEEWSPEKKAAEVQKRAGLGIRQARAALRESLAGLGADPASVWARKKALAAHGINIERAVSGARESAERAQQLEMMRKTQEAQFKYTAYLRDRQMQYQNDFTAWMAKRKQVIERGKTSESLNVGPRGENLGPVISGGRLIGRTM